MVQQPIPPQQPPMYPPPTYQPQMPPPQMAPQRPKSRKRLWLIISAVVLMLIVIGAIASQAGNTSQPATTPQATQPAGSSQQPTTQPAQPTSAPTQPPAPTPTPQPLKPTPTPTIHFYKVGEKVVTGGYAITFWYTETVEDSYIIENGLGPASKPGEYYLGVYTEVHTPADGQRHVMFRSQLTLTDTQGNAMKGVTDSPSSFNPAPNITIALYRMFVVKSNVHSYILTFTPGVTGGTPVMWKVDV